MWNENQNMTSQEKINMLNNMIPALYAASLFDEGLVLAEAVFKLIQDGKAKR